MFVSGEDGHSCPSSYRRTIELADESDDPVRSVCQHAISKRSQIIITAKYLTLICLLFLIGCASHPRFQDYDAHTPEDALIELLNRRQMIKQFSSDVLFEFALDDARIRLKGSVLYQENDGWRIELNGPFGMKLGVIESNDGRFLLDIPQAAQTIEGELNEGFFIPGLDVMLPSLSALDPLFLPTVNLIGTDGWTVSKPQVELTEPNGFLTLTGSAETDMDSLVLQIDYSPLRVLYEEHYRSGELVLSRQLTYPTETNRLPNKITINFDGFSLDVTYRSVHLETNEKCRHTPSCDGKQVTSTCSIPCNNNQCHERNR
ncbi:MAG: hypothetical protein P9M15_05395 [Candidatus Electryoneaceae bacterium]|nr:hypothetical protein [Candidatus Electryoneaceae bacterium]